MNIAIVGTGYVGLSLAVLLSQHNHVTAVDIVPEKVEKINRWESPIQDDYIEKFLEERDDPVFTKEHLGLSNARYTLNLVYHRSDLLRLSNREGGGARVEIWIPEETTDEAADL